MDLRRFEEHFATTLEDHRLSRGERRVLRELFGEVEPTPEERSTLLGRAFELARGELRSREDRLVLEWLEGVSKLLLRSGPLPTGSAEVLFAPAQDCPARLRSLIDEAEQSIQLCIFTITDNSLSNRLLAAYQRGVAVRILSDDDKALDLGSDIRRLSEAGIPVRTDKGPEHMHHKFALFDQHLLATGSYNWTRGAARSNRENILLITDERCVAPFRDEFERLWQLFAHEE